MGANSRYEGELKHIAEAVSASAARLETVGPLCTEATAKLQLARIELDAASGSPTELQTAFAVAENALTSLCIELSNTTIMAHIEASNTAVKDGQSQNYFCILPTYLLTFLFCFQSPPL